MKKPSKTAAELEASIKVELEDICDRPTDMMISVEPDGDSWKVKVVLVAPDGWLGLASVWDQATPVWINLPPFPPRIIPSLKTEIPAWLDRWKFHRFVTLATNDPAL
jgi:hypothetical protein